MRNKHAKGLFQTGAFRCGRRINESAEQHAPQDERGPPGARNWIAYGLNVRFNHKRRVSAEPDRAVASTAPSVAGKARPHCRGIARRKQRGPVATPSVARTDAGPGEAAGARAHSATCPAPRMSAIATPRKGQAEAHAGTWPTLYRIRVSTFAAARSNAAARRENRRATTRLGPANQRNAKSIAQQAAAARPRSRPAPASVNEARLAQPFPPVERLELVEALGAPQATNTGSCWCAARKAPNHGRAR